jgi:release factor glutamine methyltransferase
VLIPRPETEELLEIAIDKIKNQFVILNDIKKTIKILDIGTGSGIIPITLKKHFPEAEVSAMDISEKALEIAKKNATFHQTEINFIEADYLNDELAEKYDVIISNPPYIGIEENVEIAASVKDFEPNIALFSPTKDALLFYRKIAKDCLNYLNENGLFFLEINQKLGNETLDLFQEFSEKKLIKDLSDNDRFVVGRK